MGAKILTGYTGERHITPLDDAAVYRSLIGTGSYITGEGNKCAATMPSINEFSIASGHLSIQGVQVRIMAETLSVDTCATGKARKDLVVARWTHDTNSLIDNVELAVLKGVEVADSNTPTLPAYNTGDINDGAVAVDMPLYVINLAGSTVTFTRVAELVAGNIGEATVLEVEVPTISSLPVTISDSRITSEQIVLHSILGTPSAQAGDWTVTTSDGSLTISGSISGSTTAVLYLANKR